MRSDVTKQEAAEVLSDEIFELQFACTKAAFILQEITENYFGRYDSTNHSEH